MTASIIRRRATRVVAAGALLTGVLLCLVATPVFADGGPHVAAINSGFGPGSSLTSDGCAGCHRAHTGQGSNLLAQADAEELCLSCHGAAGTGATTNVEDGVQYALADPVVNGDVRGPEAGALRGGGFVEARIDSGDPSRIMYANVFLGTLGSTHVSVLAGGEPVTSAHIALAGTGIVARNMVWGNGGTGVGQPMTLECVSCHNPHGNGQYRILYAQPGDGDGPVVEDIPVTVAENAVPTGAGAAGVRNYTVMWGRTLADVQNATYPGGGTGVDGGDYFRRYLPWNGVPNSGVNGVFGDRPEYVPGGTNLTAYRAQITAWCSACHTRYDRVTGADADTGDPIFRYRHTVGSNPECTVCHVAHGSNADMSGVYSSSFPYPGSTTAAPDLSDSSRLLKIDNRGTCQACHDPTHTVPPLSVSNP
jgi:predicted CXXCH cytochrome family protein